MALNVIVLLLAIVDVAAAGSTTTVTSSVNPSVFGQSITFTAVVTGVGPVPTGTVTFQDAGVNIAGCVARPLVAGTATCVTAGLSVGAHSITGIYSGDVNFSTSTSAPITQTVNKGSTATTVASSVNPSFFGQSITFTATVLAIPPASGTRTGTVDFQDGGVTIAGCAARAVAVAGTATCVTAGLSVGVHLITATYSGDGNFNSSASAPLTQIVNMGNTSTALASSVNPSVVGQSVTYTATVTATAPASGTRTGTVNFQDGGITIAGCGAQPVAVNGKATCVVSYASPGSHTITAIYSGDANFSPSTSAPLTQTVNMGNTSTGLTSSANPSVVGQNVTYTATVTATAPASGTRTGTVDFQDGGVSIAGCGAQPVSVAGTATCVVTYAVPGSHTITAVYSGDANFNPSTSPNLTQTVNMGNTTTAVASSANPSVAGQAVTFTATVTATAPALGTRTGTVNFRDGGVTISGCGSQPVSLAGTATCVVTYAVPGSHTISAVYSGDANFNPSTSPNLTQTVNKGNTATAVASAVNPSVSGQSVTYTATVTVTAPAAGSPTGTVNFRDAGVSIAGCAAQALVAGTATCTLTYAGAGSHTISAVYSGDANFNTSTSPNLTQTVSKGSTTTTLGSSANPSVWGQSVTYTATVTANPPAAGTPTGTVTFKDGGVNIAGCVNRALVAGIATCSSAAGVVGSNSITAVYNGDANFTTSPSAPLTEIVNKGDTSTALTSSVNPSVVGQSVTYTATVTATAPASGTRTGTVNFQDGGLTIAGCGARAVAVAGTATCVISYASPGSHTISAIYSGDANFNPSTSPSLTQTVDRGNTSTALASSVNPSVVGQSVTFTATVTATAPAAGTRTGTVNFQDGGITIAGCGAQPVAVNGKATCVVSYASPGSHTITAIYSGDANFNTSTSAPLTQTVNMGNTSTGLTTSANPSVVGQSVTFTATVTAAAPSSGTPSGTVDFRDGGVSIAGCGAQVLVAGTATCAVTYAGPGSHTITAIYSGDANFNTSTSAPLTQTVNQDPTTTSLSSSANPSVVGQTVTFTATVTANPPGAGTPSGTVDFREGGVSIAGCGAQVVVAGTATCAVTYAGPGSHTITAIYSGDANFNTSTSAPLTQTVNQDPTTTSLSSSANPSVVGQGITYTATVTANPPGAGTPSGTVDFQDGGVSIAGCGAQALVAGTATCAVTYAGPGSHTITAVYSGDANFSTSTSAPLTQTVNMGNTSTTLTSSANPSVVGQNVTYTATVTAAAPASGTPTGTVDFRDGGVSIAGCGAQTMVAGTATCAVTYAGPGSHTITAVYSGDANFSTSTSAPLTQTVNMGNTSTTLTSSANPSVVGQSVTYTATVTAAAPASGTPTGTVDFQDGGVSIAGCGAQSVSIAGTAACVVTYAGPGSHTITAVYSGDANFSTSTSAPLTQTVNMGNTSTALTSSTNPSVVGQNVTYTATVTAAAPASGTPTGAVDFRDGGVSIAGCGAQTMVAGTATCAVTYAGPGSHTITAIYSGDANFSTSTSAPLTQIVNMGNTSTALTSSANPSVVGQTVTFTATVTAISPGNGTPTGTITFRDGGVNIAGCVGKPLVGGAATCTDTFAGVGSHIITAIYGGDSSFLTSASGSFTELILPGLPNTSAPQAGTDAVRPISPERIPSAWLAMLALIAGFGAFGIVARRLGGNRMQRRRRLALGALPVLLCLVLGMVAGSLLATHPTAGATSPPAPNAQEPAVAEPGPDTVLIGSKVVTVAKPPQPVAESFHPATGPIFPTRLRVPSIGVDARVVGVGLLSDGSMDVPDNLWTAAWLSSGARPGHPGSTVIAGHRGIGTPAVFSHLENVRPGEKILVSDAAGAELVYEVTGLVLVDLSPDSQVDVFGPTPTQQLVLITCFGKYSSSTHTYDHRLVVMTRLVSPNA